MKEGRKPEHLEKTTDEELQNLTIGVLEATLPGA